MSDYLGLIQEFNRRAKSLQQTKDFVTRVENQHAQLEELNRRLQPYIDEIINELDYRCSVDYNTALGINFSGMD